MEGEGGREGGRMREKEGGRGGRGAKEMRTEERGRRDMPTSDITRWLSPSPACLPLVYRFQSWMPVFVCVNVLAGMRACIRTCEHACVRVSKCVLIVVYMCPLTNDFRGLLGGDKASIGSHAVLLRGSSFHLQGG